MNNMKNSFVNKRIAVTERNHLYSQTPKASKNLIKDYWNFSTPTLINKHTLKKWINHMHSTSTLDNYITAQAPNEMINVQKR